MWAKKDYFSTDYSEQTSQINNYYRKIISEMQLKYENLLNIQALSSSDLQRRLDHLQENDSVEFMVS